MENTVENNEGIVLDDAVQAPETQGDSFTEEPKADKPDVGEPGWIKGRIDQAISKARKQWEQEQEAKLAPLYQYMNDREAQELVDQGEFKSIERAREYVQLKKGVAPAEPRQEPNPAIQARADLLAAQADKIKRNRGIDVLSAFDDPEIKQRVISGEWDFYDVADAMSKKTLSPVRTPNGAGQRVVDISNMSEDQWNRLQANLKTGRKYDMRK